MGLLDKVKNLFTDEVEDDGDNDTVKIREVKKEETKKEESEENKLPTFMREKIEKEEQEKLKLDARPDFALKDEKDEITPSPKTISKIDINHSVDDSSDESNHFKFPIEFEDTDFVETRSSRQSMIRSREEKQIVKEPKNVSKDVVRSKETKVAELYKDKKPEKKEIKKFKATPIISPVYGILDKNYQADEVSQNTTDNFEKQRPSKNVDFDSVRKKAYGSLAEDIKENLMCENCEYLKEVKECRSRRIEDESDGSDNDDLMYDILSDTADSSAKDITLETATENYYDYGVEYEHPADEHSYVEEEIQYGDEINKDVKILNHNEEDVQKNSIKEVPPVKSKINLLSTLKKSAGDEKNNLDEENNNGSEKKDLELTDDLFSLIDSMYEERNDQ